MLERTEVETHFAMKSLGTGASLRMLKVEYSYYLDAAAFDGGARGVAEFR